MIHGGVRRATFQVSFMIHRSYHNHHATYLPIDPYGGIPQMGTFIGRWETIKMGWYPIWDKTTEAQELGIFGTGSWDHPIHCSPVDPQDHPAALRAATFSDSDAQKNDAGAAGAVTAPNWSVSQLGLLLVFSKVYDFPSKLARSKWLMQDPQRETTSILQFIRMYLHVLLEGMVYSLQ